MASNYAVDSKRNSNIDVLRVAAALMIVFVHVLDHTAGAEYLAPFVIAARSWAVPFFFINSGYLFYEKYGGLYGRGVLKVCLRLLVLYGVGLAIYFLFDLRQFLQGDVGFFLKFLLTAQPNAGHLWFLVALIFGYMSLYVLVQFVSYRALVFLSFFIVLVGLVIEPYPYLYGAATPFEQRVMLMIYPHFLSIPFMFFGMMVAHYGVARFCNPKFMLMMVLAGIGLSVGEAVVGARSGPVSHFYIGTYISSVSLFLFALSCKKYSGKFFDFAASIGQKYSLLVYVYHLAVINSFGLLVEGQLLGGFFVSLVINALTFFFGLIFFFAAVEKFFGGAIKFFSGEVFVKPLEKVVFGQAKSA